MKRIGVLSDTHLRRQDAAQAARVMEQFRGVDLILHAGDLTDLAVLDYLEAPEVIAVAGNMDGPLVNSELPVKRIISVEGKKIGLIHGWGAPMGLVGRVAREFQGVDAVVFGHSHRPTNLVKDGVLYFNPGSAGRGLIGSGTVGLLTVDQDITGEIIKL